MTTVTGLPELKEALLSIPGKLRKRALMNALRAAGRDVQADAVSVSRRHQIAAPIRNKAGQIIRKPGTVTKAIRVRTSKIASRGGDLGVFVNVKPLPGAKFRTVTKKGFFGGKIRKRTMVKSSMRGANNPDDPYYWRFLNFGTKSMRGVGFLEEGAKALPRALQTFYSKIIPAIDRLNKKQLP
jgi:HK97 gp10 family phage protein